MRGLQKMKEVKKCSTQYVLAINDTQNVISGKWKLPIIATLLYGKKRFRDLQNEINKISPRMLSKELKELEINGIVRRTVRPTTPVRIEYQLTTTGMKLSKVLDAMLAWGMQHRAQAFGK